VDRVGYRDEVYADLRARLRDDARGAGAGRGGGEPELRFLERYGKGLAGIAQTATTTARRRPAVAVVQASGPIHLGRSGGPSPFAGHSVGSDSLGSALRAAAKDRFVRAVVLRVDSPGGSYVASDAIRREVLALRETGTPVVASMADVAGSGGYYIAMPADWIVASPGTLTGSIGVLAGKQVIRDALAHVGVQRESVSSGRYADMFSTQRRFSDDEWQRLEAWLDRVYDDFTAKAAEDRGMPVDRLREVAKGRVWTGADALGVGLVDELGGLSKAIDVACARAGLSRADVDVRRLPKTTPLDRLRPAQSSDTPAATGFWERRPLLNQALDELCLRLGLPPGGVLTMPFGVRLV
jgi:protease-4